jgi:lipopolysaccharide export LptBFGC system permease protein LptF
MLPKDYEELGLNAPITAEVDIMVFATIKADNRERGSVFINLFDQNGQIITISQASVHFFLDSDVWIQFNSVSALVKAGTTYEVKTDPTSGIPEVHAYKVPTN